MNKLADQFKKEKQVYLHDAITLKESQELTDHMFSLHAKGKTVQDDLCPLSGSIYGDSKFNALLKKLCNPLSNMLGINLLPTYSYARVYKTGEELLPHLDRDQCEVSVTITLGFDPSQKVWPIFFGNVQDGELIGSPVNIGVGDAMIYRGTEVGHWRKKFQGTWQVQLLLHYVDAEKPFCLT
jgi:hypothetical protein